MEKIISRDDFIKSLKSFMIKKAEELNLTVFEQGEDRQKGVWGEKFTEFLEKQVGGDCATTIIIRDENDRRRYLEFRFIFSNPCIAYNWYEGNSQCMVSFEFSNTEYVDSDEVYENDGMFHKKGDKIKKEITVDWKIIQVMLFGAKYSDPVYRKWFDEINNCVLKNKEGGE